MSASTTDNRTATQRIEDLEKVVTMLYQATSGLKGAFEGGFPQLQQDMVLVKDALKLLNKKTEATIQLAKPETGITVQAVSDLVVKMNVADLVAQTADWVAKGSLTAADEVADNSFLVCEESNSEGATVNPRIQFRLDSLDQATKDAFKGKKVGDTATFGENKFSAKILELYSITEAKAAEAPAAQSAAPAETATVVAETTTTAAPAAATEAAVAETPVAFGLEFHGQPEASLAAPTTDAQTATA